ncbi:MAG: hypothetical protein ACPIOQ_43300 [Promethearchaeia archaeon]
MCGRLAFGAALLAFAAGASAFSVQPLLAGASLSPAAPSMASSHAAPQPQKSESPDMVELPVRLQ